MPIGMIGSVQGSNRRPRKPTRVAGMARQRSTTDARKPVKPATRWGVYVLMGVLLAVVAAGAAAQMLAASPAPPDSAATVSTTPPAANVVGVSNAAGASSSARTLYVYGDQLR